MHEKVFHAVHVQRIPLHEDGAIVDWVAKNGIDRATFLSAWNSFGVVTRLRQLGKVAADYQVESAPPLLIDGRYQTSPGQVAPQTANPNDRAALFKATLEVADKLVTKAAQSK
jgi:thiol:disulfide interchange protein DsbA